MFEAQYLWTTDGESGEAVAYSPWFPRGGDNLRFTLDYIQDRGAKVKVTLVHKDSEDPGDGTEITTPSTSIIDFTDTVGSTTAYHDGLDELVRYKFYVKSDTNGTLGGALFRMLAPVWFDTVQA